MSRSAILNYYSV